jgi:hypothetical protein
VKSDINEKLIPSRSEKALMLIYSANPPEVDIELNINWLAKELGIKYCEEFWYWDSFPIKTEEGKDAVFWVCGYEAK